MNLLTCIALSLKSWLRTPVVFVLAILMLAVGIGASVAAYGFLNAALLQPLPVKNPQEIMRIYSHGTTAADVYDLVEYDPIFADLLMTRLHPMVNFHFEDRALLVTAGEVSGTYFSALDVEARIGRTLVPDDDRDGAAPVIVIGERFWREHLEARDDILGTSVRFNGRPFTVVGIVPGSFRGTFRNTDIEVWFPHQHIFIDSQRRHLNFAFNTVFFRLRDGVNAAQVQAQLDAFREHLQQETGGLRGNQEWRLVPEREVFLERRRDLATQSYFILGVLGVLLLIACANVSNILLSKVTARRGELAIRRAYGAPARSVFGILITDSLLIAVLAGAAGILFAYLFMKGFSFLEMEIVAGEALDLRVLLFALATTAAVGLFCGLLPAIQASRVNINEVLKESSRTSTRFRTGKVLIVFQVAFSLSLLIASGLFVRSLQEAQRVDPGIRTENLLSFSLNLDNLGGFTHEERIAFYRHLIAELEAEPEVASVGLAMHQPLQGPRGWARSWASDIDIPEDSHLWVSAYFFHGPGFFETMGIPILRGRAGTMEDMENRERVVVVSEAWAERYWPNEDPIGKEFQPWGRIDELTLRVIGLCGDFRVTLRHPPPPIFMPAELRDSSVVVLRTNVAPDALKPRIRAVMGDLAPGLPVQGLRSGTENLKRSIQSIRSGFAVMLTVALIALAISVIGVYSALSYWVRRSRHEIGLRMALGASRTAVVKMYVLRGTVIVLIGLVLGLGIAVLAMPHAADLFYNVDPRDPLTFTTVPAVLFLAALLASFFSARHAARVDPMVALRSE